ncbi:Rrg1p KNAG_0D01970 [Huiozyma naganishii CBS 8797]|uniref:Required for respiratory growth protein 1, mitochondrial n=1 Tax=Huiozyma naganishii (strain ATCC MYA-139 / BCRC 22969 / CBS 8797 / KCTC 17520 / NBRC 10181 / NCYC 3082 / Yp74L-3) TaxID=1071383 RepID=J7RKA9_HUIN7|nr:hypothetical protein KNAG_0D01970 [Kazachstania naganishii CBS 8797]CCK69948.1 hypothetical protein KNAG_0D01970 [Kazachstania naganishii CBS 8797]
MVRFDRLPNHATYVLHLYRYSIRNVKYRISSIGLQRDILVELRRISKENKSDKPALVIHNLLKQLNEFNESLEQGLISQWSQYLPQPAQTQRSASRQLCVSIEKLSARPPQDPEVSRQMSILSRYVSVRQRKGYLPRNIPKKYMQTLLLPVALHAYGKHKLDRIDAQLQKGIPQAKLAYTMAGRSRIWFVRSSVNKNAQQSKTLGVRIRQARDQHQSELNSVERCHEFHGVWASYEAQWEEYLLQNVGSTPPPLVSLTQFIGAPNRHSSVVQSWMVYLQDACAAIEKKSLSRMLEFQRYRDDVLIEGGVLAHYQRKTEQMYNKRKTRYDTMLQNELTHPFPFASERNMYHVLKRNQF